MKMADIKRQIGDKSQAKEEEIHKKTPLFASAAD